MKWIIGVALTILSPVLLSIVILYALVWKLPLCVYDIAHEIYERIKGEKHDGIGWY
jgi:hypothetical protein